MRLTGSTLLPCRSISARLRAGIAGLVVFLLTMPALAVDPPYQGQMARLASVMGSLYFLAPLCGLTDSDWRADMADLIALDQPDEDRAQRLYGAFNEGYDGFARLYVSCTPPARDALTRLLDEAQRLALDIHQRFAE